MIDYSLHLITGEITAITNVRYEKGSLVVYFLVRIRGRNGYHSQLVRGCESFDYMFSRIQRGDMVMIVANTGWGQNPANATKLFYGSRIFILDKEAHKRPKMIGKEPNEAGTPEIPKPQKIWNQ